MSRFTSLLLRAALPAALVAGCSADLPATSVRNLKDANGKDVLDANGNVVRARHVQRDGEWVPCDGERGARRLVRDPEGRIAYAGQALMNQTCAAGQCHSSAATGSLRSGAPAGLDFDMPEAALTQDPTTGDLVPDPERSDTLAVHQRRIYDKRKSIWKEVEAGHMPPPGVGAPFRADPGLTFVTLDSKGACTDGTSVGPVLESTAKQELGIWLACGSPVVQASDARVTEETLGDVGNIMPACGGGGGVAPSFDNVYSMVLDPACAKLCHNPTGLRPQSDFSTAQVAFDSLVMAPLDPTCAGAPDYYVVPNDPEASYLLHKMGDPQLTDPFLCPNTQTMPPGQLPLTSGIELIRAWIEAGAPGPGESVMLPDGGVSDGGGEGGATDGGA